MTDLMWLMIGFGCGMIVVGLTGLYLYFTVD